MQNQTAQSAAVRRRLPGAHSADHGRATVVGRGDGDSTGAHPGCGLEAADRRLGLVVADHASRKRTDSGSPHRTTTA